uniref:Uncharacterized protein n=1 Tax=Anguilla anguilla TaxID=7936 RepID=A0A0E9PKD1_ANGAN
MSLSMCIGLIGRNSLSVSLFPVG